MDGCGKTLSNTWEDSGLMADDDETPENAPEPADSAAQHPALDDGPRRAGAVTGWLRATLARRPSASRPLDGATTASIVHDATSRATRAGEVIAALAPGAPIGVIAPEGAPRVAHMIGRDEELDRALTSLATGISLCIHSDGVAGVGKSTLAVEVAARAAERKLFAGGVIWIACETLSGGAGSDEIVTRVARALREERALAALDPAARRVELMAALREPSRAPTLLALDNLEPTLDSAALLDTLVGGAVTLLLTTRRPLDDARVATCALGPLADTAAERLFSERLRLRDAQRPQPAEASLAAQVALALGGLPLLIDLTAAMVGVFETPLDTTLAEIQAESARGVVASAHARIDRLWMALTPERQRTLAGLTLVEGATFPRAVALEVARVALDEAVAAPAQPLAGAAEAWRWQAAQSLDALIGLGIVEALAAGRLRLHAQVRQRVASRLGEMDATIQQAPGIAMAEWWLTYARAHRGYEGMAGLEAEAAGLMGALTWAYTHKHWRLTLDLAEALGEAWRAHGRRDEALRIATWAAEAADAAGQPRERLWARYQLAVAQTEAGYQTQARAGFAEALRLAREQADPVAIRDCAHALAALAAQAGDIEQARAGFAEALALAREQDDPATIRDELHGLAILDAQAGLLDDARAAYTEALALARALADPQAIYLERHGLALIDLRAGALEQARAGFIEALELAHELGDLSAQIDVLSSLGALDAQRGETTLACDELGAALALAEQAGDARRTAHALVWLAEVEAASGVPAASARFEQARTLYERLGDAEAARVTERMHALGYAS